MIHEYWTARMLKALSKKEDINNCAYPKFRDVISSIEKTSKGSFYLTAGRMNKKNNDQSQSIKIYVNFDKKRKGNIAFPFLAGGTIEFPLSINNIHGESKKWFLNTFIEKMIIKNKQGELFVYVERFKSFIPLNGGKANQYNPFPQSLLKGLRLYLIVPENKTSAGEFDFLSCLHPHIWDSIVKKRVNFGSATDIASVIEHIPYNINCACVVRGGESGLEIFNEEVVCTAIQKRKEKHMLYLVSGVGHGKNGVDGLSVFDCNLKSPTAAAVFLNIQFPVVERKNILI